MTISELEKMSEETNIQPYYLVYCLIHNETNGRKMFERDGYSNINYMNWISRKWRETRERMKNIDIRTSELQKEHLNTLLWCLNVI